MYPGKTAILNASLGLNFGSAIQTGVMTWPVDKWVPESMWPAAVDIFAFDALIQNPDRRYRITRTCSQRATV